MINAGLKILAFDGTQSFNTTTKNWENISVQVNYPSEQTASINPISVNDVVIEPNGSVWKVTNTGILDANTGKFKLSLILTSGVPIADVAPNFGTVSRGAVLTPKNGVLAPHWNAALVSSEIDRIAAMFNTDKVGVVGLDTNGKIPVSQLPTHTHTKTEVGLGNVDNTADSAKVVASAAKLTTARTIGGVSFDGTANIDLPGVNTTGNQNTTGNATTATKLATARTINGVSFDGSANITIADSTKIPSTEKGAANGVATLDATGKVPSTQLPADAVGIQDYIINVTSWASGTWSAPSGFTIAKEYSDSSIRITHNKAKLPASWLVINKENDPYVTVVPTATTNMQLGIDNSYVIITNVGSFEKFSVTLTF